LVSASAAIEASAVQGPSPAADAETKARLASLGYIAAAPASSPGDTPPGSSPDPKTMVGLFQRFEAANAKLTGGGAEAAITELAALVAADPANPVFRGKLAAAPRDPEAWYNLASALQEAGHLGEARQAIEQALKLDARRPEAHNTLGIIALAEGRTEEARRELAAAAEIDPRNAAALNNLGNVLRAEGKLDEAEGAYRRSAAVAPRYAEPLNGLGALEVERDRPRAALPYFERALALAPGYHEVRLNQAIAHDLAGDSADALKAYRDFLAATAGDPKFAEQRRAAQQLLARLEGRIAGGAPAERR